MAVDAKFTANFSSFSDAVAKATVQLKGFDADAVKVGKSLNTMANSLSGQRTIQQATLMASAVEKIGGVSQLTARELQTLGTQAAEAIEKMKARGITDIPPNLQHIADTAKAATAETTSLGNALTQAFHDPIGALKTFGSSIQSNIVEEVGAAGVVVGGLAAAAIAAGTEITRLALAAGHAGGLINDMAEKTSESAEATSDLKFAMDVAGGSIEQASDLIFQMQKRMEESPKDFEKGLERIHLVAKDLQGLSPDEQLLKVARAFREFTDQSNRAATSFELFSKPGRDAIPLLLKPLDELVAKSRELGFTWSGQDAKAAEQLEMQSRLLWLQWEKIWIDIGKEFIPALTHLAETLGFLLGPFNQLGGTVAAGEAPWRRNAELQKSYQNALKDTTPLVEGMTINLKTGAITLPKVAEATGKLTDEQKRLAEELRKAAEAHEKWLQSVADATVKNNLSTFTLHNYGVVTADVTRKQTELGGVMERAVRGWMPDVHSSIEDQSDAIRDWLPPLDSAVGSVEDLGRAGQHTGAALIGLNQQLLTLSQIGPGVRHVEFEQAGRTIGEDIKTGVLKTFANFPSSLARAFEGGGGLAGAFKSLGAQLGDVLSKSITDSMSAGGASDLLVGLTGGILTAGVGIFAYGISTLFENLRTFDDVAKDIQKRFDEIGKSAQAGLDISSQLDELKQYQAGLEAVNQGLSKIKSTGVPGSPSLGQLTGPAAAQAAAMQAQLDALAKVAKAQADVNSGVTSLSNAYRSAGAFIPSALKASIEALSHLKGLTDEQVLALENLTNVRPDFERLKQDAADIGISLAQIGPKFEQGDLEDRIGNFSKTFQQLLDLGGDFGGMLTGAREKLQGFVNESGQFGTALPENIKPWLEELAKSGQLTDAAGNKITDLSTLTFEETPLDKGIKDLNDAIEHLVEVLTKDLPDALKNLPAPDPIHVPVYYDVVNRPIFGGEVKHMGGMVDSGRILPFIPKAHSGLAIDERVIIAQTGEAVLNRAATAHLGIDTINALNRGGSLGGQPVVEVHIVNMVDGKVISETVERQVGRKLDVRTKRPAA